MRLRFALLNERRKQAIRTTNVENPPLLSNKERSSRQNLHPATVDVGTMNFLEHLHLRFIPRMLMKQLESMV